MEYKAILEEKIKIWHNQITSIYASEAKKSDIIQKVDVKLNKSLIFILYLATI